MSSGEYKGYQIRVTKSGFVVVGYENMEVKSYRAAKELIDRLLSLEEK